MEYFADIENIMSMPLLFCFLSECTYTNLCVLIKSIGGNLAWNISSYTLFW